MRVHAALADELQFVQAIEKSGLNPGALADEHQGFCIFEPGRQSVDILNVVVPDCDVVTIQFLETGQGAQRIVVIVKYRDLHPGSINSDLNAGAGNPESANCRVS